jgi:hypothetical protein
MSSDICPSGKIRYFSRSEAYIAARKFRKPTNGAGRLRPYLCPYCKYWHLGHGYELDK